MDAVESGAMGDLGAHRWPWSLSPEGLAELFARWHRLQLTPVEPACLARHHCRAVSANEAACLASHVAAWRRAAAAACGTYMLVLEDDATPLAAAPRDRTLFCEAWRGVWARIQTAVGALEDAGVSWDLLYVGRNRLGPAAAETPVVPGVTRAAFSSCTHAYVVSREGAAKLVAMADGGRLPCVPVDDLLPALYAEHPRPDLASWARTQPRLEALAMAGYGDDGIVFQLEEVLLGCLQGGRGPEDPLLAAAAGSTLEGSGSGSLDDDGGIQSVLCADAREASCMHATSICGLGAALWMQVAGHLGPRDLAALRATCGFFRRLLADERLWRAARLFQLWDAAARPEEVDLLTFNGRWGPGPAEPLGESRQCQLADCLAMSLAHHSQIASCPAQDMSAEMFAREFETAGRALVLRGAAGPSMCELWAVKNLEAVCGEGQLFRCIVPGASAPPLRVRMPLPSYRRYLDTTRERDHALYLFEDNLPEAIRRLPLPDAVQSLFGSSDLLAACLAQAREANDDVDMEHEWLAIGPVGSGSRLHTDPHGTSAFNLLWSGQKLWAIFDDDDDDEDDDEEKEEENNEKDERPEEQEERPAIDTAHAYAFGLSALEFFLAFGARPQEHRRFSVAVQRPGDVVFVPAGHKHVVLNLAASVAYTRNLATPANVQRVVAGLRQHCPAVAQRLAAVAQPCDSSS